MGNKQLLTAGLLLLLHVFGTSQSVAREKFVETYVAKGANGLSMRLRLTTPLAQAPSTGWLNTPQGVNADGEFSGRVDRPIQMITKTAPVVLEVEKRGPISAARYSVDSGTLVVCMLSFAPGSYHNVSELAAPENYTLCVPMERKGK